MTYRNSKRKTIIFIAVLAVFIIYLIICYKAIYGNIFSGISSASIDTNVSGFDNKDVSNDDSDVIGNGYYYKKLNSNAKTIYDESLRFVLDGKCNYKIQIDSNFSNDDLKYAIEALTNDHPELFWINGGWQSTYSDVECDVSLETYEFMKYTVNFDKKQNEMNNIIDKIISDANKCDSDYNKIKFVHDYIVNNTSYAFDDLEKLYSSYHDASCEYIFTAYGCLVNKKAVCAGYAKAFQLILSKMGYTCTYITGKGNGENHAWNLIIMDNTEYYVDVTWDDPYYIENGKKVELTKPEYNYFMISKEQISKDHVFDTLNY